jgi:hypothetical protein
MDMDLVGSMPDSFLAASTISFGMSFTIDGGREHCTSTQGRKNRIRQITNCAGEMICNGLNDKDLAMTASGVVQGGWKQRILPPGVPQ